MNETIRQMYEFSAIRKKTQTKIKPIVFTSKNVAETTESATALRPAPPSRFLLSREVGLLAQSVLDLLSSFVGLESRVISAILALRIGMVPRPKAKLAGSEPGFASRALLRVT